MTDTHQQQDTTTEPSVSAHPQTLNLLVYLADIRLDWDRDVDLCPTQAPSTLMELPACPAVTSLDVWYPQDAFRTGLWRPGVRSSSAERVKPRWLLEFAAKFTSLHREG